MKLRTTFHSSIALSFIVLLCAGSLAEAGSQQGGVVDEFAGGTDPAAPSTALKAYYDGLGQPYEPFDTAKINRHFIHTFSGLPSNICAAALEMRLMTVGFATNDNFHFGFRGAAASPVYTYGGKVNDITSTSWTSGKKETVILQLGDFPSFDGGSMIDFMNAAQSLDLHIADDTGIDYAILRWVDSCGTVGSCAAGTVGINGGGPYDVIRINGSTGGSSRRVVVGVNEPITFSVDLPPTCPPATTTPFVMALLAADPSTSPDVAFGSIGTLCFTPAFYLLTPIWLSPGAPSEVVYAPGIGFPVTVSYQGLMDDCTGTRVTNLVVIEVVN